jgi:hypothetical protein
MMRKSRKLAKRRDRRKAKSSKWRRQGKTGMGNRVGHGPGSAPMVVKVYRGTEAPQPGDEPSRIALSASLSERQQATEVSR